jgi:hypothetical protein
MIIQKGYCPYTILVIIILCTSMSTYSQSEVIYTRNIKGIKVNLPSSDFFVLMDTSRSSSIRTQSLFNIATYTKGEVFENYFNLYGVEGTSSKTVTQKQFVHFKDSMLLVYKSKPLFGKNGLKDADTTRYKEVAKKVYKDDPKKADSMTNAIPFIVDTEIDYGIPITVYNTNNGFLNISKVKMELLGNSKQIVQVTGFFRLNQHFATIIGSFEIANFFNNIQVPLQKFIKDLVKLNP